MSVHLNSMAGTEYRQQSDSLKVLLEASLQSVLGWHLITCIQSGCISTSMPPQTELKDKVSNHVAVAVASAFVAGPHCLQLSCCFGPTMVVVDGTVARLELVLLRHVNTNYVHLPMPFDSCRCWQLCPSSCSTVHRQMQMQHTWDESPTTAHACCARYCKSASHAEQQCSSQARNAVFRS